MSILNKKIKIGVSEGKKPFVTGNPFTAYVHFNADSSVGFYPYGFTLEIPSFEEEYREQTREDIKKLYNELDGEFTVSFITFSDEKED